MAVTAMFGITQPMHSWTRMSHFLIDLLTVKAHIVQRRKALFSPFACWNFLLIKVAQENEDRPVKKLVSQSGLERSFLFCVKFNIVVEINTLEDQENHFTNSLPSLTDNKNVDSVCVMASSCYPQLRSLLQPCFQPRKILHQPISYT
jgi:hypothetical protein